MEISKEKAKVEATRRAAEIARNNALEK